MEGEKWRHYQCQNARHSFVWRSNTGTVPLAVSHTQLQADLKMENDPGAGAKIVLSATLKRHSKSGEVIDEDREIIELDRADRKNAGNTDVNAASHVHR